MCSIKYKKKVREFVYYNHLRFLKSNRTVQYFLHAEGVKIVKYIATAIIIKEITLPDILILKITHMSSDGNPSNSRLSLLQDIQCFGWVLLKLSSY